MYIFALILTALLISGCTQVVRVSHSDFVKDQATASIDTKVLIQPPTKASQEVHTETGLIVLGVVNSWDVDLNQSLPDATLALVKNTYSQAVIGHSCDDCGLIIRPKITQVEIGKVSMQSTVEIQLDIVDANGRPVTTITSGGSSSFLSAARLGTGVAGYFIPLLGTAVGTLVVRETVQDAFDKALATAANQLEIEANGGLLARTWLPKKTHENHNVGKHQYTAEQVAKTAGCNLLSDGITLTNQEYATETYTAQCWGKPEFAISCKFNQCQIEQSGQVAQNP